MFMGISNSKDIGAHKNVSFDFLLDNVFRFRVFISPSHHKNITERIKNIVIYNLYFKYK